MSEETPPQTTEVFNLLNEFVIDLETNSVSLWVDKTGLPKLKEIVDKLADACIDLQDWGVVWQDLAHAREDTIDELSGDIVERDWEIEELRDKSDELSDKINEQENLIEELECEFDDASIAIVDLESELEDQATKIVSLKDKIADLEAN